MDRQTSLLGDLVHVNTLMGLEPFEVFFFREKFTYFDLELQGVAENYSTVGQRLSIVFLRI